MPKTKSNFFRFLVFVSFLIFNNAAVQAQGSVANNYSFTQGVGPAYVDLPAGTGTSFIYASSPDGLGQAAGSVFGTASTPLSRPIGFDFVFNNATYNSVFISDNGFITFGSNSPVTTASPISGATVPPYNGVISGYGMNLVGNVATPATSPWSTTATAVSPDGADIKYHLDNSGGPGNFVFIVEFKNMKRRVAATTHNGLLNFQIRLYQSNMKIEIQYKNFASLSTSTIGGQVGLRGLTPGDFNNRQGAWATSTAGLANNANLVTSNTAGPTTDLMYTWTPTCFSPTGLVTNLQVDNTTVNFSWTAPAYLTAGFTGYDWEVRTSGAPGSGPAGRYDFGSTALTSDSVTGLSSGVPYFFYVKSNCGTWTTTSSAAGATGSTTTITVSSTVGLHVGMSVVVSSGLGVFASGTTITSIPTATTFVVSTAPTTALSGGATVITYSTFLSGVVTPLCTTPVFPYIETFEGVVAPAIPNCTSVVATTGALMRTRDAASPILFPPGTPIGSYGGFANKNLITGSAAAADTWFFSRVISLTAGTTYRVSYKYGGSREATSYSQRMRVGIGLTATAAGITNILADHINIKSTPNTFTFHFVSPATGNYFLGFNGIANLLNGYLQIDDISLNTATCSPPTALTAGAITFNSAVVSWTPPASAPSAGYEYIISTSAVTPIATTPISGANLGTVTTFTSLLSSTSYFVWVRSNCAGDYSAWSTPVSFTTLAPPTPPCVPAPTSVDGTGITNVTIGSINNTTGAEPGNYGNYTNLVTNIAQNTTVPVTIRYSTGTFSYWTKIWIDFNDNGSFADAGETVYNSNPVPGELPPGVNNISFFVPLAAPLGQHRMRIGGSDTNNLDGFGAGQGPCYNGPWGTFEDYSVLVTAPPPPLILSSSSTSFCNGGTSPLVTLNFNAHSGAPAVRYDNFVWNPSAGVVGTPAGGYTFTPTNAGVNVYTLTATQATFPFISNTVTYTVTVNDVPTPIVFTPSTLVVCEGIPTQLTSGGGIVSGALIVDENFNSPTILFTTANASTGGLSGGPTAAAWTLRNSPYTYGSRTFVSNDASQFYMSNSDAQGSGGTTNTTLTLTDEVSFAGYTNVSLSYWQYYRGWGTGTAQTQIWNDVNGNDILDGPETWVTLQSFSTVDNGSQSNFVNQVIDLTPYAGLTNVRIRFNYSGAIFGWYWAVDNVRITGSGPASLSWAPTTGLWLDPAATTTPYTGGPATAVYARLSNDITYTATAAALSPPFCSTSSVLNITVNKAGTASGNQTLACGDTTLSSNITLTGYVPAVLGTISGWQIADNPSFISPTTLPGSAGKDVLTPADVSGLTGTTYFRAMFTGCPTLYSNTITVSYPTSTWTGSWSPGPPGLADNVTVASGTLTIASDLTICSLRVNNNATVIVNPGVTLTVNGTVAVNGGAPGGTLTFLGDNTYALGSASLMQNPATTVNANSGIANYRRWTRTRKFDYTYWSSPVNPMTLINVSPTTLVDKFLRFDSNAYVWTFPNPALTTMTPGVGYAIRGPQAFSDTVLTNYQATFTGTPNNGNYSVTLFRPSATNDLNFVGNPYPSAISADAVMDGNVGPLGAAGVGTTFYFWTHNTLFNGSAYVFSDYAAYNRTGGVGTAPGTFAVGGNNAIPNGLISAGQGFMVKAVTPGTLTFTNSMRVGGANLQFYRMNNNNEKSRLWLDFVNANDSDEFKQLLVGYVPNATNAYEDGLDGEMVEAGNTVSFYSLANGDEKNLMIQGRALPFDTMDMVSLGYRASSPSTYRISVDNKDGLFEDDLVGIYLEDKLLNVIHDLRQSPYQFVTESGTFNTRFVLRYNNGLLGVDQGSWNENNVVVFKQNEQIQVESSLVKMKSVKIYDVQGRLVIEKNDINSQSATLQKVGLANQVLMVQITSVDGVVVSKKIIF